MKRKISNFLSMDLQTLLSQNNAQEKDSLNSDNKWGIYTVANDRMAIRLATFLESVRTYDETIPVFVFPFDEKFESVAKIAELYNAKLVPCLPLWDVIGENVYGDEEYRPSIKSAGYFRKLNVFTGPLDNFIFLDANTLTLSNLASLTDSFFNSSYDIGFMATSMTNRTINVRGKKIISLLDPNMGEGYNTSFFIGRKSAVNADFALGLSKNQHLRKLFGKAPEQAFLAYYLAISATPHCKLNTIDPQLPLNHSSDRPVIERDGGYYYSKGHLIGKRALVLKWTGQQFNTQAGKVNDWIYIQFKEKSLQRLADSGIILEPPQ